MLVKVFCGENDTRHLGQGSPIFTSFVPCGIGRSEGLGVDESLNLFQRIGTELFVVLIKKYFQENLLLKDSIS